MNVTAIVFMVLLVTNVVTGGLWLNGRTALADLRAGISEAESTDLREAKREVSRLITTTNNLNEAYRDQTQTIDRMSDALRARGLRVSKAERDAAIAAASTEAVRGYAATAADNFSACRSEYVDLGQGYGRCAAAAQSLDQYASQVSRQPSRPSAPNPPSQP